VLFFCDVLTCDFKLLEHNNEEEYSWRRHFVELLIASLMCFALCHACVIWFALKYHIILHLCSSVNTHEVSWNMWNLLSFGALMECVIIKNPELMILEKLIGSFKDSNSIRKTWICHLFYKECRNLGYRLPGN